VQRAGAGGAALRAAVPLLRRHGLGLPRAGGRLRHRRQRHWWAAGAVAGAWGSVASALLGRERGGGGGRGASTRRCCFEALQRALRRLPFCAGVVHQAPAFGEDDYRVCLANGVIEKGEGVPCPVDLSGMFTAEITDFAGAHVKVGRAAQGWRGRREERGGGSGRGRGAAPAGPLPLPLAACLAATAAAITPASLAWSLPPAAHHTAASRPPLLQEADKDIIAHIKELGRLVDSASITHSYPFCWRSDTPLIYRWGSQGGGGLRRAAAAQLRVLLRPDPPATLTRHPTARPAGRCPPGSCAWSPSRSGCWLTTRRPTGCPHTSRRSASTTGWRARTIGRCPGAGVCMLPCVAAHCGALPRPCLRAGQQCQAPEGAA
jgi:hypothetical protein